MTGRSADRYATIFLIVGGALVGAATLISCAEEAAWITEESGPIEQASWVAYAAAALLALVVGLPRHRGAALAGSVVLLALAARELDFHARFTTRGVLSMRFWTTDDHSLATKIVAGLLLSAVIAAAFSLVRSNIDAFRRAVAARRACALTALAAIALLPLVKILDRGLSLVREHTGAQFTEQLVLASRAIEESLELAIPILLITALMQFWLGGARSRALHLRPHQTKRLSPSISGSS